MSDQTNVNANVKIGVVEKIGYGLGDFASNLSFGFISLFMLFYFTNVYNISATDAALIFAIARIVDAVYNLFIGYIIDITHSRFGKMRPFLLFGAVPLGILSVLCFTNFGDTPTAKFIYALISYTAYSLAYTTVNTPYSGLNNTITQHAPSRGSLSAYRLCFAYIGYLCVSTLSNYILSMFDNSNAGYLFSVSLFSILATVLFLACFALTKERVVDDASNKDNSKLSFRDVKLSILQNTPLIFLSLFTTFFYIVYTVWMAVALYYIIYVMADEAFSVTFFAVQSAASIVGAVIADPLVRRIGKKNLTYLACILGVCCCTTQYFIDPQNKLLIMTMVCGISITLSMGFVSMWAMIADTVEYAQYQHNVRKEGIIYGFFNFVTKIAMAIGGAMAGIALDMANYDAANVSTEAVSGINFLMTIFSAVMFFISLVFIFFYAIDEKFYQQIIENLEKRKQQQVSSQNDEQNVAV